MLLSMFRTCLNNLNFSLHYFINISWKFILNTPILITTMYTLFLGVLIIMFAKTVVAQNIYEADVNFRVDAGTRTCFFEKAKAGQVMELQYQVLDGQHGELDISVDVMDPNGMKLISDYKRTENSIIMELEHDGDYVICLDNNYSIINSKLVYLYVVIENKENAQLQETEMSTVDGEGEDVEEEILEWIGTDEEGNTYALPVTHIIESLKRTLNFVVRARHMLDIYSATKSRDSYLALEDTFIVDAWSAFQIVFMTCVGVVQAYMIKKLFDSPYSKAKH